MNVILLPMSENEENEQNATLCCNGAEGAI